MERLDKSLENFNESDGFLLVVPEYGGMAAPNVKISLLCGNGEFSHNLV